MNDDTQALLSQLRDIHTPHVSAWPAALWWVLSGIMVLGAVAVWVWRRRIVQRGWLRQAHAELLGIRQQISQVPAAQSLADLSQLTRRVVLARSPRTSVASVQGDEWLTMLDQLCGNSVFTLGHGRLLASGPYRHSPDCSPEELTGLADNVEQLIDASARQPADRSGTLSRQRAGQQVLP